MFKVVGNNIYINRGEEVSFIIVPLEDNGEEHVMEASEFLRLTVRKNGCELWREDTEPGSTAFTLTSRNTKRAGRFDYDVKLMYPDGSHAVIIGETENFTPHFTVLEG